MVAYLALIPAVMRGDALLVLLFNPDQRNRALNALLSHQIQAATLPNGALDTEALLESVKQSYQDAELQHRLLHQSLEQITIQNQKLTAELEAQLAALRQTSHRFSAAIESLSHGLCIYDADNRLVMTNQRFGEMYDLAADKLVPGTHLLDIVGDTAARGVYRGAGTVEDAAATLAEIKAQGSCERVRHLSDGWIIQITFNLLADGGWIALHKDITEQRLAEQRLIESEQRFRDFVTTASDWCWETDENHRFCFFTSAFQTLTGIDPETMFGKTRAAFAVVPEDQPVVEATNVLVEAHEPFEDLVYRIRRADGSLCWIRSSGTPRFGADQQFLGYRGTGSDVSAEQEHKLALADSEARLRDFLDTASDWTWETDVEGRVVALSQAYDTNGAFNRNAMLGQRREDHPVIDEHRERMAVEYTARMAARQPIRDFIYGVHRPDGSINYIRVSGNPIHASDGAFVGYRGTSTNVTVQVEATLAREAAIERFRDFADSAADWCWETDAEHRYVDPDSFMGRGATFGSKNYVGKRRIDLPLLAEDRPVLEAHMLDLAARRSFKDMLYRIPSEDGSIAWIKASGKPVFDARGDFTGYRGTARDVTDEEVRKRDLRQAMESFRDFAEAASDWFWETDKDHRFQSFSDAFTAFASKNSLAHVGKTRLDFDLHPDDRPRLEAHFDDLAARQPFKDLLYRIGGIEQRWVWIKASGKPVFDSAGTFVGYRGSASNVTEEMTQSAINRQQQFALQRAGDVAKLGYWRWLAADKSFEWSPSIYDMLGFGPDERSPDLRKLITKVYEPDRAGFIAALKELERGFVLPDQEYRYQRSCTGEVRYFQLRVDLEHDQQGQFTGTFGIIQDITDLKLAEAQLRERSEQLVEAQKLGRIGDWSYQFGAEELWWSPEVFDLLGYSATDFVPTREAVMAIYRDDGMERLLVAQAEVIRTRIIRTVDVKGLRGDGLIGDYAVTSKAMVDANDRVIGFAGTIQDISERKQAEEQLEKLAYYDPLTGLANRALFRREIDEVLDRVQRMAVSAALLLLDLDRFKEVNDSLGHAAGDELLGKVGHIISRIVGSDCFLARLGGDEFAIVIPDDAAVGFVEALANEVISALNQPFHLERGEVHIGTSIGIVLIPRDGSDSEELLRHADLALYRAKEEGRGRFAFFASDMNDLVQQKTAMARDLRHAVATNLGLEARYQPQVDLASNRVIGFETLMRWKHPSRGYVPPNDFIPIAESSSLICDLGLWIMRESATQAKLWLELGETPRELAVNVSAAQIWQTDLEVDVARILDETGLPPHLLCLELTESLFADHAEGRVRRALTALKKLGVTLALDDFGTGYSSLGYLTQLPFDKLKIDRCFVDGIVEQPRKRKLLQGMIALGRGLGMTVIAEGAEKLEELDILREYGCDIVQGFVFAKPTIASEAISFAHACEDAFGSDPASLANQLRKTLARAG